MSSPSSSICIRWKRLELNHNLSPSHPITDPDFSKNKHTFQSSWDIKRWAIDESLMGNILPFPLPTNLRSPFGHSNNSLCDPPEHEGDRIILGDRVIREVKRFQNPNSRIIFTDGSLLPNPAHEGNGVGFGFAVFDHSLKTLIHTSGEPMHPISSIYSAELLAIQKALDFCLHSGPENCESICILSDCRSAIQSLLSLAPTMTYTTSKIFEIASQLSDRGVIIRLYWIPGHIGLAGNDLADSIAKNAALSCISSPDWSLSLDAQDMANHVSLKIQRKWEYFGETLLEPVTPINSSNNPPFMYLRCSIKNPQLRQGTLVPNSIRHLQNS
jgi:ribonuclease HI